MKINENAKVTLTIGQIKRLIKESFKSQPIMESMKVFRITCVKHGNVANYNQEAYIEATSEKMALKKFFNQKGYNGESFRQRMRYEQEANGIYFTDFEAKEVTGDEIPDKWNWGLHTIKK